MSGTVEQKMSISSKEKRQLLAQLLKRKALSEFKYSPLSFAQQQLWFLNQLEPENPFYNIPFALHLKGPLQVEVLERSLREIVRRHEALRTTFGTIDGLPQQVIAPKYNQATFLALEPMTDRIFCGHWLKRSKHCWAAVSNACFVSKNSQWVTSRRKCLHSISIGLSQGLYVGKESKTRRPAAARTTSSTSSSSCMLALSQAT